MCKRIRSACLSAAVVSAAVFFTAHVVPAESLEDYHGSVKKARAEIALFLAEDSDLGALDTSKKASAVLRRIAGELSGETEIEYESMTTRAENGWLSQASVAFENVKDPAQKKLILKSVDERLEAISAKMENILYSGQRDTSKDDEKQILSRILEREEFGKAEDKGESPAARLYRLMSDWLRSLFPEMKPVDPKSTADLAWLRSILQITIFVVVAVLLVYVIYKFAPDLIRRARSEKGAGRERLILGEAIGPDTTTGDLFAEAERLARDGDIRGAIRKGYISLLLELSQRKLIGLAKHKTNRDYLRDLQKREGIRSNVSGLTLTYERHWYGRQNAKDTEWEEFKQGYQETLKHG